MRFTSNGYPANYIIAFDYDSSHYIENRTKVLARLDQLIDEVLEETGTDKVDLIGHSYGGLIVLLYLNETGHSAKVAHCVIVDSHSSIGRTAPEGVPTLALWGEPPSGEIPGATNLYFPDKAHVEMCTCADSFVEMYKFFTGREPLTKDIIPEPPGQIRLSGKVVYFPWNIGVAGATLEIWEVNGDTGFRIHKKPKAVYTIHEDGAWGPFKAKAGVHYEFAIIFQGPNGTETIHYYREPFIRSDHLIRILVSPPRGVAYYADRSPNHCNLLILRYKEFWGDRGVNNDILAINDVNVVNAATCPRAKRVNGIWVYDKDKDGVSNLTKPIEAYFKQPFQTGVDLFIPATDPPNATISLVLTTRGGGGKIQVVNVPNWASLTENVLHRIVVQFNDYLQDINFFQECMHMWRLKQNF
jgi:hypothetical protein